MSARKGIARRTCFRNIQFLLDPEATPDQVVYKHFPRMMLDGAYEPHARSGLPRSSSSGSSGGGGAIGSNAGDGARDRFVEAVRRLRHTSTSFARVVAGHVLSLRNIQQQQQQEGDDVVLIIQRNGRTRRFSNINIIEEAARTAVVMASTDSNGANQDQKMAMPVRTVALETMTFRDQMALVRRARVMLAASGAGVIHTIWWGLAGDARWPPDKGNMRQSTRQPDSESVAEDNRVASGGSRHALILFLPRGTPGFAGGIVGNVALAAGGHLFWYRHDRRVLGLGLGQEGQRLPSKREYSLHCQNDFAAPEIFVEDQEQVQCLVTRALRVVKKPSMEPYSGAARNGTGASESCGDGSLSPRCGESSGSTRSGGNDDGEGGREGEGDSRGQRLHPAHECARVESRA